MLSSLRRYSASEVAQKRLDILNFYEKYGEKATYEAFGVNRKLICVWKKRLAKGGQHLSSLIPVSTKPHTTRRMLTNELILAYIREQRKNHPGLGKEKIKPLLDKYCIAVGVATIAESTVGKVIKRNNLFSSRSGKVYHNPGSGWAQNKAKKSNRLRVKYAPKPEDFGHLQMDTVTRIEGGVRVYLYSAIDIKLKFSLSLPYKTLNSANTLDFFKKLLLAYPLKVESVQTDNGLEFLGLFDSYLKEENIPHCFIYPRCPRINGVIERYNRTLQEEFLNCNLEVFNDPKLLSEKLADYLLFYNLERPHKSLGLKSPLEYLVLKGGMSKKSVASTMTFQIWMQEVKYFLLWMILPKNTAGSG